MGSGEGEAQVGTGDTVVTVGLQKCWEMSTNRDSEKENGGFYSKQRAAGWSKKKLKREECFGLE